MPPAVTTGSWELRCTHLYWGSQVTCEGLRLEKEGRNKGGARSNYQKEKCIGKEIVSCLTNSAGKKKQAYHIHVFLQACITPWIPEEQQSDRCSVNPTENNYLQLPRAL